MLATVILLALCRQFTKAVYNKLLIQLASNVLSNLKKFLLKNLAREYPLARRK
jgi:hypothetical protein